MNFIDNNVLGLSKKVLDFIWQKQTVTLDNIANAETPGYKARYVTFEDELISRLEGQQGETAYDYKNSIQSVQSTVHESETESTRADGNNVNIDVESMELAKAALQYQFLIKSINDDFTRLGTVIKG